MTPKAQRIGILVIAIVMVTGTLGSFAMMILANKNNISEQKKASEEYQAKIEKQEQEAKQYYPIVKEQEGRAVAFDAATVGDKVTFVDIKEGDGEVIGSGFNNYQAYYIGWNPTGKVFDSSINGETLKAPLDLKVMTLIPGWYDGVDGMKIGGIREITIPAALAYGETGQGADIPANTPIKFLIVAIPASE